MMTFASSIVLTSLSLLIRMHVSTFREQDKLFSFPPNSTYFGLPIKESFDFIVVGAGTSGCIVARRLADARFKVLLLEAGGNPPPLLNIPFVASFLQSHTETLLPFQSVLQSREMSGNRSIKSIVGKMMGGSSTIDYMQYKRGSPYIYDQWSKVTKDRSWRHEQILQYFKKAEDKLGIYGKDVMEQIELDLMSNQTLTQERWLNAGTELGYNIGQSRENVEIGFSPIHFIRRNGMRVNTYDSYLKPVEETLKPFLEIRRYSVASKILFDGKRASGVHYTRHGVPRVSIAEKEVILCTGTFFTPLLLFKSGIGSHSQLQSAKIPPIVNLPEVGQNLLEHPVVQIGPIYIKDNSTFSNQQNLTFEDLEEFVASKTGPLMYPYPQIMGEAYVVSKTSTAVPNKSNLQISFGIGSENNSLACFIALTRPFSRGSLRFNFSANEMDDPFAIVPEFHFLETDGEIDAMVDGIELCLKVFETESFKELEPKYVPAPLAPCDQENLRTKEYWTCYVKHMVNARQNAVGTCRMGQKYEIDVPRSSVVDHKFRVHDVEELRIVDASIMPTIPNTNVVATTMMIAEKASEIIVKHHCRKLNCKVKENGILQLPLNR